MKRSSRLALIGATAVLALSAGFSLPAAADTTAQVDLDNDNAPLAIITSLTASVVTAAPTIVDLQDLFGANTGTTTVDNTNVFDFNIAAGNDVINTDGNAIFTRTQGNDADNSIGTSGVDGAIIVQGQQLVPNGALVTSLAATTNDNLILSVILGDGQNVTATVNENVVDATVSFNTSFSTIETTIPANLADGTQGSYGSDLTLGGANTLLFFPTAVDQTANFNVTTVQVNFGFANGNAADLTTASVDDTTILLARSFPPVVGQTVSGDFEVNDNTVSSATLGNASDNSIFLHSSAAAGDTNTFGGTAFVSTTQSSNDSTPVPGGEFPGISASTEDTNIIAAFATVIVGPPLFLSADGLAASVDGNDVTSSSIINSARNELAFDGDLALAGGDSTTLYDTGAGTIAGEGDLDVDADFGVVSNQTATSLLQLQSSQSVTEDTLVALLIEDVDDDSSLSLSGNAVVASAGGQDATNIIRNTGEDLEEGSVSIVGRFATGNRQYIINEAITALVTENQLSVEIGTEDDGGDPFGGLVGSALTVDGNAFNASATANDATAQVDISGLTIDITGDQTGAVINSERFGVSLSPPDFVQNSDGGVNIGNWQFVDSLLVTANAVQVDAEVANSDILVLVNFDQGSVGNEEVPEVANSVISVDGNAAIASAALNSYDATANISADTSLTGSLAALSYQSTSFRVPDFHDVDATVFDSELSTLIGVNGSASSLTVTTDGNDVLALANGNDSAQIITAEAGTSISANASDNGGGANAIFTDTSTATEEVIQTDIEAYAAYLAVSDQALRATQVDSRVQDFEVNLLLASTDDDANPATLSDSTLSLSNNDLIAQTLGNSTTNSISLDAGTTIFGHVGAGADVGPSAGIVSSQTTVQETALGDSHYEGEVLGNTISASILETGDPVGVDDITLDVDGNRIQGLTFANSAVNDITLSGNSFVVDSLQTATVAVDPGTFDLTMFADDSAVYILNRQRNEGLDETVAGPTVESFASLNSVLVNLNGGVNGVDSSTVSATGNSIQATAAATVASNTITLDFDTTAATGASILNRQGNSGNVNGDNEDSLIEANLLGEDDAIHDNVTLNVEGNAITSSATGNSANNLVQAEAGELVGVNNAGLPLSGAYIGPSPLPSATLIGYVRTDGATLDANANAVANGNLVVLNTQRNYGIDNDGGQSLINGETENAEIFLNVDNADVATNNSTLSLSTNQVRSSANANSAINTVSTTTSSGGPALTTVLNDQGVQNTNVTSAATETTIALNVDGDFDGGSIAVDNNQVIASGGLNTATNTIQAQSSVGDLPSATIINHQSSTDSSVSATNTGTTIANTTGLFGGSLSNSTVSVSGNQIGATTTINSSTNTIGAPGQTFTRTSSF
jgi:hypothetical protein